MKKIIVLIVAFALAGTAAMAGTDYWDFDDGTFQGWGVGYRNGPQDGLSANIAHNWNYDTSLALNLHANRDTKWGTFAYYYLPDLGYTNGCNSFRYSSQITYNDLRAMWNGGLAYGTDQSIPNASAWYEGRGDDSTQNRDQLGFKDTIAESAFTQRWENAYRIGLASDGDSGVFNNGPSTVWMQIDYNSSVAGKVVLKFMALDYSSVLTDGQNVLWEDEYDCALQIDPNTGDYYSAYWIRLGGEYGHYNLHYDNVMFEGVETVPEPGTMAALGTGLVGLAGFAIRRRK